MFTVTRMSDFPAWLESEWAAGQESESEIIAKRLPTEWIRVDAHTGHNRPSLKHIEMSGKLLGVEPANIISRILSDVLNDEAGGAYDFLHELFEWIIDADQAQVARVIGSYSTIQGILKQEYADPSHPSFHEVAWKAERQH